MGAGPIVQDMYATVFHLPLKLIKAVPRNGTIDHWVSNIYLPPGVTAALLPLDD